MDDLYIIKIDNENLNIKIFNEFGSCNSIDYDGTFEIKNEYHSDDCEDFNDIARWLTKTILEILKAEEKDNNMHCDWSAENKYEFTVKITKKGENND